MLERFPGINRGPHALEQLGKFQALAHKATPNEDPGGQISDFAKFKTRMDPSRLMRERPTFAWGPWEKGYGESFNSKFRDGLWTARSLFAQRGSVHHRMPTVPPQQDPPPSSLVYRRPSFETLMWPVGQLGHTVEARLESLRSGIV